MKDSSAIMCQQLAWETALCVASWQCLQKTSERERLSKWNETGWFYSNCNHCAVMHMICQGPCPVKSVDLDPLRSLFSCGHDFVLIKLFWLVASFSVCVYICVCACQECNAIPLPLQRFEKARCNICSHPPAIECLSCKQCHNAGLWHHAFVGFLWCLWCFFSWEGKTTKGRLELSRHLCRS